MTAQLILASSSPFRRQLMDNAGLVYTAKTASIDERAVEKPLAEKGAGSTEIARALAIAKAKDVSGQFPGAYVIGSDQVMSMDAAIFHKCTSLREARSQLLAMRGKVHLLESAVAIVKDGETLWSSVPCAKMTFRNFSERFVDDYLEETGDAVLRSVGAYQLEGRGIQLFEKIEGDYFTILGLPMLLLLNQLRALEVING